ncbi:unnamed protein product [Ilex paraguariensis]|uniref:DNA-directed DNA polymerase n=1 Tax=Ilex paraguariensis TaxID=185542 RepID=A0ABC8RB29_9AQUA
MWNPLSWVMEAATLMAITLAHGGLLKNLVERRRMVKSWLKTATGLKVQQLDIQQQALKLTANRFYAKPLAELITLHGWEILQSTVDLVQNNLNLEIIYGDTDSIMIYSGHDDISKAKVIAGKVIQEVNKKYGCLEIDLDGIYKRMLLLKNKKYAAAKVIERKGLDMVRRDWSLLSKELGDFCLSQILSGGSCQDMVKSIHNSLMKVALRLRLKKSGYVTGCSDGDTVPYIISCEQDCHENSSSSSTGIAQKARHPDELKKDNGKWIIDIEYYLA